MAAHRHAMRIVLILLAVACARGPSTPPTQESATTASPELSVEVDPLQLVVIRLGARLPEGQAQGAGLRAVENAALALALLESGLAEIRHVLPIVDGALVSPGLAGWTPGDAVPWRAEVSAAESSGSISVMVNLCDAGQICTLHAVDAEAVALPEAMAALYAEMAARVGRAPLPGAEETWAARLTGDAYALRVAGRAAASLYGLLPPLDPKLLGNWRRDPVARAVFLDPSLSLAQWIAGRRALQLSDANDARQSFTRAVLEGQKRMLFRADEAAAMLAQGRNAEAVKTWEQVRAGAREDVRFVPGHARALLGAGAYRECLTVLDALPARYQRDVTVLPLRARLAELGQGKEDYDGVLAEWQALQPDRIEPRLRRIQLRVRQGQLPDALAMVQELTARQGGDTAAGASIAQLGMALAVGTGDWSFAERQALVAKLPRTAGWIRARAALEGEPTVVPPDLQRVGEPAALLARGHALLAGGRFGAALTEANHILEAKPWNPEALALRARAQWGLGRASEAQRTEAQLRYADPAWPADTASPPYGAPEPAGPSTAPGSTGRSSQSQDDAP